MCEQAKARKETITECVTRHDYNITNPMACLPRVTHTPTVNHILTDEVLCNVESVMDHFVQTIYCGNPQQQQGGRGRKQIYASLNA